MDSTFHYVYEFPMAIQTSVLDSERSDECIDFTITCRNNASISNFGGGVSDSKINLVGALGRSFFEFPNSFQKHREKNRKKIKEKREFLRKTSFRPNRFLYGCNSKTNHCKYLKFSPNVPYEFSNFYEISRKRENLKRNDNDLSSNNFKYFISRRYLKILPLLRCKKTSHVSNLLVSSCE
ncbi:Uncharacterized protein FWK35_00011996 [Aphis craccivora]|uniref:Uncharacterized protein n=1 Tax=Aphis craccivora TaxID=307492 RepID=A0A6G0Z771_APHCR|nr:Uncharacterized protein FWK35_00011996 [Aphis craccivora]